MTHSIHIDWSLLDGPATPSNHCIVTPRRLTPTLIHTTELRFRLSSRWVQADARIREAGTRLKCNSHPA